MRSVFVVMLLLALGPAILSAEGRQDTWDNLKQLQPGHKIKVVDMDLKAWDGRLVSVSDGAITIRDQQKQVEISVERAKVLRVTDLDRSRRARNALLGFAIGTTAGVAAVSAKGEDLTGSGKVVVATGLFGGSGAAVGALIPHPRPTIYRARQLPESGKQHSAKGALRVR